MSTDEREVEEVQEDAPEQDEDESSGQSEGEGDLQGILSFFTSGNTFF